jgi:dipeptidyl aminopeptidase/acylaminoacyl peptidase
MCGALTIDFGEIARPMQEATILLVPRRMFRNPDRANVQLSSDGTQLAWTEPVGGIQNVFVAPVDDLTRARQLTHETERSITGYSWGYTNRHLVILRDRDGSENTLCYSIDIDTGHELALIDQAGVRSFSAVLADLVCTFPSPPGVARNRGRALMARSPITFAERIVRPLLIIQGMNDVRVKPAESEQIVAALQRRDIPVTYATFSDEGHGFVREENRQAFTAVMEAFLAQHLGGAAEPVGDAFAGSTISFVAGRELIPGMSAGDQQA